MEGSFVLCDGGKGSTELWRELLFGDLLGLIQKGLLKYGALNDCLLLFVCFFLFINGLFLLVLTSNIRVIPLG